MKKLMIALAAVAMAAGVQAATVSWQCTKNTAYKYNTVYLIDGKNYDAVLAALDAGGSSIATTMNGYDLIGGPTQLSNKGVKDGMATLPEGVKTTDSFYYLRVATTASGTPIADDMAYAFSAAYTYQDFLDSKASVSGADTPVPMVLTSDTVNIFTGKSGTIGSSGGDTPEPTSGLLLLLGVAGLALRRKLA